LPFSRKKAPSRCTLIVYHIAVHLEGMNYVERYLLPAAAEKEIAVSGDLEIDIT
jgi:hypothetical protein